MDYQKLLCGLKIIYAISVDLGGLKAGGLYAINLVQFYSTKTFLEHVESLSDMIGIWNKTIMNPLLTSDTANPS
jgi:hypothetical protein